jgi:hypothetical protein
MFIEKAHMEGSQVEGSHNLSGVAILSKQPVVQWDHRNICLAGGGKRRYDDDRDMDQTNQTYTT